MSKADEIRQDKRYPRWEEKAHKKLIPALDSLYSDDEAVQKKAIKVLLSQATQELGWLCLPVREWFTDPRNRQRCFNRLSVNMSSKMLSDLLRCFHFVCERMIDHNMWGDMILSDADRHYKLELHKLALQYMDHASTDVRADAAYILAMAGDMAAWDMYVKILHKKASYCGWMRMAYARYGRQSVTETQKQQLGDAAACVLDKSRNPSVRREANLILTLLKDEKE